MFFYLIPYLPPSFFPFFLPSSLPIHFITWLDNLPVTLPVHKGCTLAARPSRCGPVPSVFNITCCSLSVLRFFSPSYTQLFSRQHYPIFYTVFSSGLLFSRPLRPPTRLTVLHLTTHQRSTTTHHLALTNQSFININTHHPSFFTSLSLIPTRIHSSNKMSGREFPDNSMSRENNRKRSYDEKEYAGNEVNNGQSAHPTKRLRISHDDDEVACMEDASDLTSPSSSTSLSMDEDSPNEDRSDEDLSNVEVNINDLESISEDDVEDLRHSLGDIDYTNENIVIEAIGTTSPLVDDANDEDDQAMAPRRSAQPLSDEESVTDRPLIRYDTPHWTAPYSSRFHGGKEYLRLVMSEDDLSDDEF